MTLVPRLSVALAPAMLAFATMFVAFAATCGLIFARLVTRRFTDPGDALPNQFLDRADRLVVGG